MIGTTMDIDRFFTAPLNLFIDHLDYYQKCSTKDYLKQIATKTFVLTSKDDPFINVKNYQNDWSGTWNGVNVPDGTYFYFVRDDKKGEMVLTGYLQVLR